jgi:hypothetical protein
MIDAFLIMIFLAFFTFFTAILYQGVKRVFPDYSKAFNLVIALSLAFTLASLVTNPEQALYALAYPFPESSIAGIFAIIMRGMVLLGVSVFVGLFVLLFILASTQFFRRKMSEIRIRTFYPERLGGIRTTRRFIEQARVEPEITEATEIPSFDGLNHTSERRRSSDLILELDLTQENE